MPNAPTTNLNLVVYDNAAFFGEAVLRSIIERGHNLAQTEIGYRTSQGRRAEVFEFFYKRGYSYAYVDKMSGIFYLDDHMVQVGYTTGESQYLSIDKFKLYVNGPIGIIERVRTEFEAALDLVEYEPEGSPIYTKWAMMRPDGNVEYMTMPVRRVKSFFPQFYPFIGDVDAYLDGFMASDANVLVLSGEPGSGKSNLIRYFIYRNRINSVIAYDEHVMMKDSLFINFLTSSDDALILEDADLLLRSRLDDDNKVMSKILNTADGIIDSSRKKFIFTANLQNLRDIDPALTRPGRCYDVKHFRSLTKEEAEVAATAAGIHLDDTKSEFTVAEIYTGKKMDDNVTHLRKASIGFK